jgi:ABC-type glycerol-3-phosphate transport system substrate-binding protein
VGSASNCASVVRDLDCFMPPVEGGDVSESMTASNGLTRRQMLAGLIATPTAAFLASCSSSGGGKGTPSGTGTAQAGTASLSVENWVPGKFPQGFFPVMSKLEPAVKMSEQVTPYANYEQKLLTQLASKTAPDIVLIDAGWNGDIFPKGILAPFNDYVKSAKIDMSKWNQGLRGNVWKGDYMGLPLQAAQQLIIYVNKDIAQKDGLLDDAPVMGSSTFNTWHWDDFVDWVRAGTKTGSGGTGQYGVSLGDGNTLLKMLVASLGGQLLDEPWNYDETKSLLDSDEVIEAAQAMTDLVVKYHAMPTPAAETAVRGGTWLAGKAMSIIMWADPAIYPQDQTFPQAEFLLPYFDKEPIPIGYNSLAVPTSGQHVDEAIEWVTTLTTSLEGREAILSQLAPPAYDPNPAIDASPSGPAKDFATLQLARTKSKNTQQFPRWNGRYAGAFMDSEIQTALEKCFNGSSSVKDAFTTAKQNVDGQIADKRKSGG